MESKGHKAIYVAQKILGKDEWHGQGELLLLGLCSFERKDSAVQFSSFLAALYIVEELRTFIFVTIVGRKA